MITSQQNNQIKQWVKLHTRKEREKTGLFLVEGFHLIEEAFKSDWVIEQVILREDVELPKIYHNLPFVTVSHAIFSHLSRTKTPQGIMAVISKQQDMAVVGNRLLLIDGVQDPGNLGTMIRTADAAGFNSIILGEGTVDVYNDKVIRATQGSLFHLNIVEKNLLAEIEKLKAAGYKVWATALNHATNYLDTPEAAKMALILGNEGAGVQEAILKMAHHVVTIPIYGKAESLNVSVAAGILMYHMR